MAYKERVSSGTRFLLWNFRKNLKSRNAEAFLNLQERYSTWQNMLKSSGLLFVVGECYIEITEKQTIEYK